MAAKRARGRRSSRCRTTPSSCTRSSARACGAAGAAATRSPRSRSRAATAPTPTSASSRTRSSRRCSPPSPTTSSGTTERVIYLTAAMTGMRRGELLALRWQDVDMSAGLIRVRRNYTPRRVRHPEDAALQPRRPDGRAAAAELEQHHDAKQPPRRRRPRLLPSRHRQRVTTPRGCGSASRPPPAAPASGPSASTTSATPSAPGWPPPARRCERSRSGWATATTAPRASTPTTRPISPKELFGRPKHSRRRLPARQEAAVRLPPPRRLRHQEIDHPPIGLRVGVAQAVPRTCGRQKSHTATVARDRTREVGGSTPPSST